MGLGIYIGAEIRPKGLLKRRPSTEHVLESVAKEIPKLIDHPLHESLTKISRSEGSLEVQLHPAEESVEFRFDDNGILIASAKTSSAGPGYHAFLVGLLELLDKRCGLVWIWDSEEKEFCDETGYAGSQDFTGLQREMAKWLRGLADMITKDDEHTHLTLSLPLGFHVLGDYFAISSMGYWDRSWFESFVAAESEEAFLARASEFFPWWEKDRNARFWLNCGLVKSWVDIYWRPAKDDHEQDQCQRTLQCFDLARRIDSEIPIPYQEIEELKRLIGDADLEDFIPGIDRIGFRRKLMSRPLTGGWTVNLPGYYYDDTEDDGTTVVYWYGQRTVRGSSFSFEGRRSNGDGEGNSSEEKKELHFSKDHLKGDAEIYKVENDDESYWQLQGKVKASGKLCGVTVCYEDPVDKEWAVETWKSVFVPAESK